MAATTRSVSDLCRSARDAARRLARLDTRTKNAALTAIADALIELKSVCTCGRKATMNLRVDASGQAVREGAQTEIGGNDRYVALCRRHFCDAMRG